MNNPTSIGSNWKSRWLKSNNPTCNCSDPFALEMCPKHSSGENPSNNSIAAGGGPGGGGHDEQPSCKTCNGVKPTGGRRKSGKSGVVRSRICKLRFGHKIIIRRPSGTTISGSGGAGGGEELQSMTHRTPGGQGSSASMVNLDHQLDPSSPLDIGKEFHSDHCPDPDQELSLGSWADFEALPCKCGEAFRKRDNTNIVSDSSAVTMEKQEDILVANDDIDEDGEDEPLELSRLLKIEHKIMNLNTKTSEASLMMSTSTKLSLTNLMRLPATGPIPRGSVECSNCGTQNPTNNYLTPPRASDNNIQKSVSENNIRTVTTSSV